MTINKNETEKEGFNFIPYLFILFVGLLAGGLIASVPRPSSTPSSTPPNEPTPPTQIVGMYLNFDSSIRNLDASETCTLILKCVDSTGRLDTGRGDTVIFQLSENTANAVITSTARINLVGGLGFVSIKARNAGMVTVSADWVGGYSFLRPTNAIITFR